MQTMPATTGPTQRRAVSAGTVLIALSGLALYQLTSLALGPAGNRQLHLSLNIPTVEGQLLPDSLAARVTYAVGSLARPARVVLTTSTAARQQPITSASVKPASKPIVPAPLPTPAATSVDHRRLPVVDRPQPEPGDDRSSGTD
jgi:hypothetical protein